MKATKPVYTTAMTQNRKRELEERFGTWTPDRLAGELDRRLAPERRIRVPDLEHRIIALDRLAQQWLHNDSRRTPVVQGIQSWTGLHPAMIDAAVVTHLRALTRTHLTALLERELGDARALQNFDRSQPTRFFTGQGLLVLWMPGNLPGPGLLDLALAVLTGTPFLMRVSGDEPLLVPQFWNELIQTAPDLASMGLVTWWPHEETSISAVVLQRAHTVVAYGYDATLRNLVRELPGPTRWLPYPHRISFALIDAAALRKGMTELAMRLAEDLVWFDQQGCMSPHSVYILGGDTALLDDFGQAMATALETWQQHWPRRRVDRGEAMRIQNFRARYMTRPDTRVWLGENLAWTVIRDPDPTFTPSCGLRTLLIKPLSDGTQLLEVLAPHSDHLQTLGYALATLPTHLFRNLARLGVKRFTPLGHMQKPPPLGCHDGRPRLLDIVQWVQWERTPTELQGNGSEAP